MALVSAVTFAACGGDAGRVDECNDSTCAGSDGAGRGGNAGSTAGAGGKASGGNAGQPSSGGAGSGGASAGATAGAGGSAGATGGSAGGGAGGGGAAGKGGSGGTNPDGGAPMAGAGGASDAGVPSNVGDPTKPWKILFVGNSFTFNSGVAGKTKELVTRGQSGVTIQAADLSVNWNRGLYYHWNFGDNVSGGNTRAIIKSKAYTHVALQDFMMHTTDKAQPNPTTGEGTYGLAISTDYEKRMIDEVKQYGQIPIVWSIWPEEKSQGDFETLILAYKKIAQDNGAVFVPGSAAWYLALKERPGLPLWDQGDHYHPSGMGGYAVACVFYAVLTGKTPVGNMYVSDNIDAATAKFLQEKAWQAYQTYGLR